MKKILARVLVLILALSVTAALTACGDKEEKGYAYEVAMITASSAQSIDDESYTQAAWEGLREFAEGYSDDGLTYKYYEPKEDSLDGRLEKIDEAVNCGAKVIACAGAPFEEVIYTAQEKYKEVKFILLDGEPVKNGEKKILKNTVSVSFKSAEAGYLAGYATVSEGYRDIAYMGEDSSKASKSYGYGFVQGANDASSDRGGYPTVRYVLCENGESAAKTQKRAEDLYSEGTEVIFVYGDEIFNSVAAEADIAKQKVISAGIDRNKGKTVIASAVKNYKNAMKEQLTMIYDGNGNGGKIVSLGADEKAVDLKMKKDEFVRFDLEDYKNLYKKVQKKTLKQVNIKRGNFPATDLIV